MLGRLAHITATAVEVRPDPRKLPGWIKSVEDALDSARLISSEARQLAGRLLFARCSCFGRTGAAHLRRLFNQSAGNTARVKPSLREALIWWLVTFTLPQDSAVGG